jgi:DNA mismatch endonuclease (patch repair protein)
MTDLLTPERRSWNMSRIRSKNTLPEKVATQLLRSMGYVVECHRSDLPGKPDIVLPRRHTVIFVHGCFWHRHRKCKFAYVPKTRLGFWKKKFRQNVARDITVSRSLRKKGWSVHVIWECETRDLTRVQKRIESILSNVIKGVVQRSLSSDCTGVNQSRRGLSSRVL